MAAPLNKQEIFLISNFRLVPNVICFLLGNSLAFRNVGI